MHFYISFAFLWPSVIKSISGTYDIKYNQSFYLWIYSTVLFNETHLLVGEVTVGSLHPNIFSIAFLVFWNWMRQARGGSDWETKHQRKICWRLVTDNIIINDYN